VKSRQNATEDPGLSTRSLSPNYLRFLGEREKEIGRLDLERRSSSSLSFHAAHCLIIKNVMVVKFKVWTLGLVCDIKATCISLAKVARRNHIFRINSAYNFSSTSNDNRGQILIFSLDNFTYKRINIT